jgi:hypothetical protein
MMSDVLIPLDLESADFSRYLQVRKSRMAKDKSDARLAEPTDCDPTYSMRLSEALRLMNSKAREIEEAINL